VHKGPRTRGLAVGSSLLPWAPIKLAARPRPVKGLVGLDGGGVYPLARNSCALMDRNRQVAMDNLKVTVSIKGEWISMQSFLRWGIKMEHETIRTKHTKRTIAWDPAIAALVEPVASYICSADDPGQAILVIVTHLAAETNAILGDAQATLNAFRINSQ
jgi:hypothetical protein